jgi:ABC-type antimicrobial peptide transport system permease subunit
MLRNNLQFSLRRLSRQKIHTSLHILGLTLGMGVCILIGLFIRHELSFDRYHSKANRTYRVNSVWNDFGNKDYHYSSPFPLATEIRKSISSVEHVTHVHHPMGKPIIEIDQNRRFKQEHIMMTDPEFLNVFDITVLRGNAYETLRKPYQAILTESTANKFFGKENPIGKTFKYNNDFIITVTAMIRDFPGNTHLPASMILSLSSDENYLNTSTTHFGSVSGGSTFITLPEETNIKTIVSGLKAIYDRTVNSDTRRPKGVRADLELQPLNDVHFNSKYAGGGEWVKAIDRSWLWFFGIVGIAVLALACINFINLSTAQAITRAKEIGVRKSIGAGRVQLITQFLAEAWLLVFSSGAIALLIAHISLPYINKLSDKKISFDVFHSVEMTATILIGIILTGLVAGLYPAWLITKFHPAVTLKSGMATSDPKSSLLRKSLVVLQFSISIGLLIALMFIGKQMNYLKNKKLGFDKENILIIPIPDGNKKESFAQDLKKISDVKDLSLSTSAPGSGEHWGTLMSAVGQNDPARQPVTTIYADEHYCRLYKIELKEGRFIEPSDSNAISNLLPEGQRFPKVLVNEKLVKALGYESHKAALGQRFWTGMNGWKAEIIGIVADFNVSSLHEEIKPTLITQYPRWYDRANVKINSAENNIPEVITQIESVWKKSFPSGVFEFNFLDEKLDALYKSETRLFTLFQIFSGLAMFISCLGLWGLATFAAERKTKEIGIRKVLGASVAHIAGMLSKDFIKLVFISILIACPLAYYGMHTWLQDFAYRINISWTVFAIAGCIALIIALITVSFQSIKAAFSNPVKSLRTE